MKVGIIGTGSLGTALSRLIKSAGHDTQVGSRAPETGQVTYETAISESDVVILAVPFSALDDLLPDLSEALAGKIVIDATNPLEDDWSPRLLGQENSAGERVQALLPNSTVVKAFNTVFADIMNEAGLHRGDMRATAFIASDNAEAGNLVCGLASDIGFAPRFTGPLTTGRYLEAMAHLNIAIGIGQQGGTGAAFLYSEG